MHMPVPPGGKKDNHVCQLHRWAHGKTKSIEQRKDNKNIIPTGACAAVNHRKACEVDLCLHCFELFHTVKYLYPEICTILSAK
mmetsp:Transcript_17195/g.26158  ORF Transcript_17195/g.26158 Transcript_17195/m.26158 type:complete len:83 (-) Transcript_17195:80-328(-)